MKTQSRRREELCAAGKTATWGGKYVIAADQDLRIYDAGPVGGAVDKGLPLIAEATFDQLIYQSRPFVAVERDVNANVQSLI